MHDFMLRTFAPYLGRGRALELGLYLEGEFTKKLTAIYDDLTVVESARN